MSCVAKQNWVEEKGTYSFCRGFYLAASVKSYEKLEKLQIKKKGEKNAESYQKHPA